MRDLAKQEYAKISVLEEIKWKQKAKGQWLKEGDKNMIFFHKIASARRNTNYIHSLLDEEGREVDPNCLKSHFHIMANAMAFYKSCWDVIKSNLVLVFNEFYVRGTINMSMNLTFIALIP